MAFATPCITKSCISRSRLGVRRAGMPAWGPAWRRALGRRPGTWREHWRCILSVAVCCRRPCRIYGRRGEKALARSAYREAVGYFEQALRALPQLPETRGTREQAIDLRLAQRSALNPSGDFGRSMAYLREAESLVAALDDPRRLGQVSLYLSVHFSFMGAYDQAIATAPRALALATASGDAVLHALAN